MIYLKIAKAYVIRSSVSLYEIGLTVARVVSELFNPHFHGVPLEVAQRLGS